MIILYITLAASMQDFERGIDREGVVCFASDIGEENLKNVKGPSECIWLVPETEPHL